MEDEQGPDVLLNLPPNWEAELQKSHHHSQQLQKLCLSKGRRRWALRFPVEVSILIPGRGRIALRRSKEAFEADCLNPAHSLLHGGGVVAGRALGLLMCWLGYWNRVHWPAWFTADARRAASRELTSVPGSGGSLEPGRPKVEGEDSEPEAWMAFFHFWGGLYDFAPKKIACPFCLARDVLGVFTALNVEISPLDFLGVWTKEEGVGSDWQTPVLKTWFPTLFGKWDYTHQRPSQRYLTPHLFIGVTPGGLLCRSHHHSRRLPTYVKLFILIATNHGNMQKCFLKLVLEQFQYSIGIATSWALCIVVAQTKTTICVKIPSLNVHASFLDHHQLLVSFGSFGFFMLFSAIPNPKVTTKAPMLMKDGFTHVCFKNHKRMTKQPGRKHAPLSMLTPHPEKNPSEVLQEHTSWQHWERTRSCREKSRPCHFVLSFANFKDVSATAQWWSSAFRSSTLMRGAQSGAGSMAPRSSTGMFSTTAPPKDICVCAYPIQTIGH